MTWNRDYHRLPSSQRGYDAAWRRNRAKFLNAHPGCKVCGQPATDVDHIVARINGGSDRWDNLEAMCHRCHSIKTASHDMARSKPRGCDANGMPLDPNHPWRQ